MQVKMMYIAQLLLQMHATGSGVFQQVWMEEGQTMLYIVNKSQHMFSSLPSGGQRLHYANKDTVNQLEQTATKALAQ